jgi:cbb3-type cytochrome oxidase subunit 3
MNFVEKFLGVSPEGGSGAFEFVVWTLILLAVVWSLWRRSRQRGFNR